MAAFLKWLSRPPGQTTEKFDEHCPTTGGTAGMSWRKGWSRAEAVAAHTRASYLRNLISKECAALGCRRLFATGDEAVALQGAMDQHWDLLRRVNEHASALCAAIDVDRDVDFDNKFWTDNASLLHLLPEELRPTTTAAATTEHFNAREQSAMGIRKRLRWHNSPMVA